MRPLETYKLPVHWAGYLINGDASGIDAAQALEIDDWVTARGLGFCVGCSEEPEFDWHNDGPNPSLGGDVLTYTFEVLK